MGGDGGRLNGEERKVSETDVTCVILYDGLPQKNERPFMLHSLFKKDLLDFFAPFEFPEGGEKGEMKEQQWQRRRCKVFEILISEPKSNVGLPATPEFAQKNI